MLDPNFDPLQMLQDINNNQIALHNNYLKMVTAHNNLAAKVEQQDQMINHLIKNLDMANKANEILLKGLANDIQSQLKI